MKTTDVRLPYLVKSGNGNLFIEYRALNPKTGVLERYRISKGLKGLDGELLQKRTDEIIKHYAKLLTTGWRPWHDSQTITIEVDPTEYVHPFTGNNNRKNVSYLRGVMAKYLQSRVSNLKPKSYANYQSKIRVFLSWCENNYPQASQPARVSNEIIIEFFDHLINRLKRDKRTIGKYKQVLHGAFEFMLTEKLINKNPVNHTPHGLKLVDKASRPMTNNHLLTLLRYWQENDRQMYLALIMEILTLCRPGSELRLLKIQDIDLQRQNIYINEPNAKTKKRIIVMPDVLVKIIEEFEISKYPFDYYLFGKKRCTRTGTCAHQFF